MPETALGIAFSTSSVDDQFAAEFIELLIRLLEAHKGVDEISPPRGDHARLAVRTPRPAPIRSTVVDLAQLETVSSFDDSTPSRSGLSAILERAPYVGISGTSFAANDVQFHADGYKKKTIGCREDGGLLCGTATREHRCGALGQQ